MNDSTEADLPIEPRNNQSESDEACEHHWVHVTEVYSHKGNVLSHAARKYLVEYGITPKMQKVYECRKCGDTKIDPP